MTEIENNRLNDWLEDLAPFFFNQSKAKPKPLTTYTRDSSHALTKLQLNCYEF